MPQAPSESEPTADAKSQREAKAVEQNHDGSGSVANSTAPHDAEEPRDAALREVQLIAALFDGSPEVRDAASEALAQLGDAAPTDPVIAHLPVENGSNEMSSVAAAGDVSTTAGPVTEESLSPTLTDDSLPSDEAKLLLDEAAARKALEDLSLRLDDTTSSRSRLEREALHRLESEARVSAEFATRLREEEELRERAEAEATQRRRDEEKKLADAHAARIKAEEEAQRFAQEDAMLRLEVSKLRLAAEEIARTRSELQSERRAAAERARLAEAQSSRQRAELAHKAEMERLRSEEESLEQSVAETALRRSEVEAARQKANQVTLQLAEEKERLDVADAARQAEAQRLSDAEQNVRSEQEQLVQQVEAMRQMAADVAARRAEVESAREKAAQEATQLAEAQARMKTAAEARHQAEAERVRIEGELHQKAEEARRLLDEIRVRAEEERQRIEAEQRYRAAEQEQRLTQLAALRERMDNEAQQRNEQERQTSSQIESLRIADTQARKRIEDAETRRRKAEESFRLVSEKTQRFEAEARKSELAEAQVLAKLEEVRRNVAVTTQSAAEQEKRIKDETENLRRMEEAQRRRIEDAARRRAEAEYRLQQEKERLQSEEEARLRAAEHFDLLTRREHPEAAPVDEWRDDPLENLRPTPRAVQPETPQSYNTARPFTAPSITALAMSGPDNAVDTGAFGTAEASSFETPTVSEERQPLPEEPAAPVAGSAIASPQDAFSRITARFEDPSPEVRSSAARELRELDPSRMVESFTRALEESTPERRTNIGKAMATSGLAAEVIDMLGGESREETYSALCLLLAMAKTGEVQPLVQAIERHDNVYVRIAAVRLLTLNGQEEIANAAARRRLEVRD
ncbi:MAG TPA: hypothetical protein VNO50_07790 [Pyrinomonadaceae bacterium]|nr:hypothetical protein [Pyrinomonadaceae bacterium]